jgi:hypothetical protein
MTSDIPARREEALVPFATKRGLVPRTTEFRSTWLASSLLALRERQLLDRYLEALPREHHDAVLGTVAGVWLPAEVSVAHYTAVETLGLTVPEQIAIGEDVARHAQGTVLSVAVRLAKEAGVTPWTVLVRLPGLWNRIWVGGAIAIFKLGPKEARVEIAGWTSAHIPYCRNAMRGVLSGLLQLFCGRVYVHEIPALCTPLTLGYRVSWA